MNTRTVHGLGTVLTAGSSATDNFFPLTPWFPAADIASVRGTIEMRGDSGDIQISPAYEYANDPDVPDGTAQIGSTYRQSNGIDYAPSWTNVTATTDSYQWVRFGVFAKNETGSDVRGCLARIKIDVIGPATAP